MRANLAFLAAVAAPLLAAALAVAPLDWADPNTTRDTPSPAPSNNPPPADWIAPFAARLIVDAAPAAAAVDADPLEGWRLVGLVEGDDGAWATVTGRGQVRTLAQGDQLAGYELVRLDNDMAVFRRGEDERTLRLPR